MEPKPDIFCNGGDQNNNTIPELFVCRERGIELRDGFGNKIQSSSWLTGRAVRPVEQPKLTERRNILALFDVDGTLTPAREKITTEMKQFLATLRTTVFTALTCFHVCNKSVLFKQYRLQQLYSIMGDITGLVDLEGDDPD